MKAPACIRQYNMLTIHFNGFLLMRVCSRFVHIKKQNFEKYMYEISSGVKNIFCAILKEHSMHLRNTIDIKKSYLNVNKNVERFVQALHEYSSTYIVFNNLCEE